MIEIPGSAESERLSSQPDAPIGFSRPFFDQAEAEAAAAVIRSGWIVGGPCLATLEAQFATHCAVGHAIGVSSWTTGAFLVLHAWGIGPGDEVIVPSLTFIATVNVVRHVGATPVFADVNPATWNIDVAYIAERITPRTRVIMPVDQLGLPCDIDAITALARRHGLKVLDDAACAFGSRNRGRPIGGLAPATVFSLHARKVVTTGEGGMIVTDDGDLAARLRRLRQQGMSISDYARHGASPTEFETYPEIGYNHRMTDIQAAIGVEQLKKLDRILAARRRIADRYNEALGNHPLFAQPVVPDDVLPNWQTYQVTVRSGSALSRNEIMDRLFALGIPTRRGVMASHLEAPYASSTHRLPHTEAAAAHCLQLPMHPALTDRQQERIVTALNLVAREAFA